MFVRFGRRRKSLRRRWEKVEGEEEEELEEKEEEGCE